jgi:hypothetical protein
MPIACGGSKFSKMGGISARRLLVAYGNEMHGDEGASWELARQAAAGGWPVLCAARLGSDLVEVLHGLDEVVFVDCAPDSPDCGLCELNLENEHEYPGHCLLPAQLLRRCRRLHAQAPLGWTLTLVGEDFGSHLGLSERSRVSIADGLDQLNRFFPRHAGGDGS